MLHRIDFTQVLGNLHCMKVWRKNCKDRGNKPLFGCSTLKFQIVIWLQEVEAEERVEPEDVPYGKCRWDFFLSVMSAISSFAQNLWRLLTFHASLGHCLGQFAEAISSQMPKMRCKTYALRCLNASSVPLFGWISSRQVYSKGL